MSKVPYSKQNHQMAILPLPLQKSLESKKSTSFDENKNEGIQQHSFIENEPLSKINGFILPSKKDLVNLEIEQLAGYLSRKSHVFIELTNQINYKLLDHINANNEFMLFAKNSFGENSENFIILNIYRTKIENPSENIKLLGKKLIEDYNYNYFYMNQNPSTYNIKKQMCLIKLEQLFIQNKLPTCYLEELTKSSKLKISGRNAFNWIYIITDNLKVEKVNQLKEYLDEYFQYLFDRPKSIWCINNLSLPLSEFDRRQIDYISQYAGFLNRNSIVVISLFINKSRLISNVDANDSFMSWFRSIFGKDSNESLELQTYRSKIENLNETIKELGRNLVDNYNNCNKYTEQQQSLINLEQFLIRYNLPSSYVYDSISDKKTYIENTDALEWIYKITNNYKDKVDLLKLYLDEYNNFIFDRPKDEVNLSSNGFGHSISGVFKKIGRKKNWIKF